MEPTQTVQSFDGEAYEDLTIDETTAPVNHGRPLLFSVLCDEVLQPLQNLARRANNGMIATHEPVRYQREKILERFYLTWRQNVGPNIYPAWQLMLPHLDRARMFDIKDYKLPRELLELLKVGKNTEEGKKIMAWKREVRGTNLRLSDVLMAAIEKRRDLGPGGKLTIDEVNEMLDELADTKCKKEQRSVIFQRAFEAMSARELRFFIDIIGKRNLVSQAQFQALTAWHPSAQEYLKVVQSLKAVAYKLCTPDTVLKKAELTISAGKAFIPQRASRTHKGYPQLVNDLHKEFLIEEKLDGERMQLHWLEYGEKVRYLSRVATDYTYLYGHSKDEPTVSKYLRLEPRIESCVLDGEMLVYDAQTDSLLPFGVLKGTAKTALADEYMNPGNDESKINDSVHPLYVVFDILYLNGVSISHLPLKQRKAILKGALTPVKNHVEIIDYTTATTEAGIHQALSECIAKGAEGIVLKDVKSDYKVGVQSPCWVKLKPEYLEEFGDNVDLVVIGREKSRKDKFYCGLRITEFDTDDEKKPLFWSFCRIANGFTKDMYAWVENETRGKWRSMDQEKPPSVLIEFGKRVPPEWIDPRDSFVIQVRARSVDRSVSANYKVSSTLYNAYCSAIREKKWDTATTLDEYKAQKQSTRSVQSDYKNLQKKKLLLKKREREQQDEMMYNNPVELGAESTVFEGLTFKILNDAFVNNVKYALDEVQSIVKRHGGLVISNETMAPNLQSFRIIGSKDTVDCLSLIDKGYDVIRPEWIFDSIERGKQIKVSVPYIYDISANLLKSAQRRTDPFGHDYALPMTVSTLDSIFKNNVEYAEGKKMKINPAVVQISLFGGVKAYFVHDGKLKSYDYRLARMRLEAFGGEVVEDVGQCTIVIVVSNNVNVVEEVKRVRRKLALIARSTKTGLETVRVTGAGWIFASIDEGVQVDPEIHQPPKPRVHAGEV